jgi:hypothetical protein
MSFFLVATVLCVVLAGCYTLQPVGTVVPAVGTRVALDVNDAGRVALGGSMGPEIDQIEGLLLQRDSAEYLIAVSSVQLLRGGEQRWNGESVHVKNEFVTSIQQRTFSPGRTIALSAVGVAAVGWLLRRSLFPEGSIDTPVTPPESSAARRVPVRPRGLPRSVGPLLRPIPLLVPHLSRP